MAKDFSQLADHTKTAWAADTHRVYEAASAEFTAEVNERVRLGALLGTTRKAQSLTQTALSELTGIQQAEISRIERGAGNPTAATLLRLADALGQKLALTPQV